MSAAKVKAFQQRGQGLESFRLPRIATQGNAQLKRGSLGVNRDNKSAADVTQRKGVIDDYDKWLSPAVTQNRLPVDGSESPCSSSRDHDEELLAGGGGDRNDEFRQRIPSDKDLATILFASHHKSVVKWKKSIGMGKDARIGYADDELIESQILQIMGKADGSVFIQIPRKSSESLGIKLPYFNMIIRNLDCYFSFEIQILDNIGLKRTLKMSNFVTLVRIRMDCCSMPMRLDIGWNQIVMDLPAFVKDAFGTKYRETIGVKINANVFVRRIYFSSEIFDESVLPAEYKMFHADEKQDKGPIVRRREESEPKELRMNDIVLRTQSGADLLNGIFESTSGYIVIDEENWDSPKLVTMDANEIGIEVDLAETERRKLSQDGGSLKAEISTHHTDRIKSFVEAQNAEETLKPELENPITCLLECLSEIYDFLGGKPKGFIPGANGDTVDDLYTISKCLKDMASFTGNWEHKPKSERKMVKPAQAQTFPPKDITTQISGDEEEPSKQILTASLSKQVLAHAEILEKRKSMAEEVQVQEQCDVPDSTAQTLPFASAQDSCDDFKFQAYVTTTLSLKQFASISSELLQKLESNSQVVSKLSEHVQPIKSTEAVDSMKSHLRKMTLILQDVASVTTLEAVRLGLEKQESPEEDIDNKKEYNPVAATAKDSNSGNTISTKLIKTVKNASTTMLQNFSTDALEVLSELLSPEPVELKAEKVEPISSYDVIPCESRADLNKNDDCDLNLRALSEIWEKFYYGIKEEFAPGFALPRNPSSRLRPLTSALDPSSDTYCTDPNVATDNSKLAHIKRPVPQRKSSSSSNTDSDSVDFDDEARKGQRKPESPNDSKWSGPGKSKGQRGSGHLNTLLHPDPSHKHVFGRKSKDSAHSDLGLTESTHRMVQESKTAAAPAAAAKQKSNELKRSDRKSKNKSVLTLMKMSENPV